MLGLTLDGVYPVSLALCLMTGFQYCGVTQDSMGALNVICALSLYPSFTSFCQS